MASEGWGVPQKSLIVTPQSQVLLVSWHSGEIRRVYNPFNGDDGVRVMLSRIFWWAVAIVVIAFVGFMIYRALGIQGTGGGAHF
jgi:hypothetical protein